MTATLLPTPGKYATLPYPERRAIVERLRALLHSYAETEKEDAA